MSLCSATETGQTCWELNVPTHFTLLEIEWFWLECAPLKTQDVFTENSLTSSSRWHKDRPSWGPPLCLLLLTPKQWLSEGFPLSGVTKVHVSMNSKGQTFPKYSVCGSFTTSAADITVTKKKNLFVSYVTGRDWSKNKTAHKETEAGSQHRQRTSFL